LLPEFVAARSRKWNQNDCFPGDQLWWYGYPIPEAAQIAVKTTHDFLATVDNIDKVTFVLWGEDICDAYREAFAALNR